MIIALISEDVVKSIVEVSSLDELDGRKWQAMIDITDMEPKPSFGWSLIANELVKDGVVAGSTISRKISRYAFRQRFTAQERMTIIAAARQNNPVGYAFQDYLDSAATASYVDLDREDLRTNVLQLVGASILTSERAEAILLGDITDTELYKD